MFIVARHDRSNLQRGDTIIEVLIVIAVITLVLAGAYVTTNRSLLATRAAQERGNALKLAETQIEEIKGLAATNPTALFNTTSAFCIAGTPPAPVAAGGAECTFGLSGNAPGAGPQFTISIERTNNYFVLSESWTDVSGRVTDSLQMRYRVYE
jgi:prepilin-type N-terminal cleavage/methylation domain-containing protein